MNKVISSSIVLGAIVGASLLGSAQTHATTQTCVDATVKSNLVATIANHDTFTVGTKNNAPVCNDVTLYVSSYTMPANYNGKAFEGNTTATPQTKFDGTTVTLTKDSTAPVKATVKLPACDNYQTDLYYGPEIVNVDAKGHGAKWITGEINGHNPINANGSLNNAMTLTKDASCNVTPGQGGGTPVTPETPAAPVTALPSTGLRENLTIVIAAALAAGAYGITYAFRKNRA